MTINGVDFTLPFTIVLSLGGIATWAVFVAWVFRQPNSVAGRRWKASTVYGGFGSLLLWIVIIGLMFVTNIIKRSSGSDPIISFSTFGADMARILESLACLSLFVLPECFVATLATRQRFIQTCDNLLDQWWKKRDNEPVETSTSAFN